VNAPSQAHHWTTALIDFVQATDESVAAARERFTKTQLAITAKADMNRRQFMDSRFAVEGRVGDRTPLDLFIAAQSKLSDDDRALLESWHRSFLGLFAIDEIAEAASGDRALHLTNWLTQKHYTALLMGDREAQDAERLKAGDILLAHIAPLSDTQWLFLAPWMALGKLGKPKLAVAIGSFRDNYKPHLYGDAPDLLEEAWISVERYHQQFVDFFGSDTVTLPGRELNQRLNDLQDVLLQEQLDSAGIDQSKSLRELATDAGVDEDDLSEQVESMGASRAQLDQALSASSMKMPRVELPRDLRQAEHATALSHPRWGQVFLPSYHVLCRLMETESMSTAIETQDLFRQHLKNPEVKTFVLQDLAQRYPAVVEALVQRSFNRPDFVLETDLEALLVEFGKPLQPQLPETASVPVHLHNLFQEVVVEMEKPKTKKKTKKKAVAGFQR
jgi:hypothetical protein